MNIDINAINLSKNDKKNQEIIEKNYKNKKMLDQNNKFILKLSELDFNDENEIIISKESVKINELLQNIDKNCNKLEIIVEKDNKNKKIIISDYRKIKLKIIGETFFSETNIILLDSENSYDIDINLTYNNEFDNSDNVINMFFADVKYNLNFNIISNKKSNNLILNQFFISKNKNNKQNNICNININEVNNHIKSKVIHIVKESKSIMNHVNIIALKKSENHQIEEEIKVFNIDNSKFKNIMIPHINIQNNKGISNHSAELIKFNEKNLFYIMSRGVDMHKAKHLIFKNMFHKELYFLKDEDINQILNGLML